MMSAKGSGSQIQSEFNHILNAYEGDNGDVQFPVKSTVVMPANYSRLINLINRQKPAANIETFDLHVKGDALLDKTLTVIGSAHFDTAYIDTYADIQQLRVHGPATFDQGVELTSINSGDAAVTLSPAVISTGRVYAPGISVDNDIEVSTINSISDNLNGTASYNFDQGGGLLTDAEGVQYTEGSTLSITKYKADDSVGSFATLADDLITFGPHVRILGDLLLGDSDNTVQAQLDDLEERILQEVIALASNYTLDFAQQAAISALALLLKPKGYELLPDEIPDTEFPDSNAIPPITCFPAGKFTDELPDEFGQVVSRINTHGKITVNANVLPTRTMTVGGDALFLKYDDDDEFECEYTMKLGSKVAVYDAQQVLQNPQVVAVRLGTNSLVTASGELQAAIVKTDDVVSEKYNGIRSSKLIQRHVIQTNRLLHVRSAEQAYAIASLTRKVSRPKLSTDYTDQIVRVHDTLMHLQRELYTSNRFVQKDYSDAIVVLHDKLAALQRSIKQTLLAKDWSSDIADLKSRNSSVSTKAVTLPVKNYDAQLTAVRADVKAVYKTVKPHVDKDYGRALKKTNDRVTALQTTSGTSTAYTATLATSDAANLKVRIDAVDRMTVTATATTISTPLTVAGSSNLAAVTASTLSVTGACSTGTLTVNGDINVSGVVNTINTTTINVDDKLINLANVTTTASMLDGAGLKVGTGAASSTLLYNDASTSWVSNRNVTVPSINTTGMAILPKINLAVLSDTAWGIYRATTGAATSFAGGAIAAFAGLTGFCTRFRSFNASNEGFVFENSAETPLLAINGSNGNVTCCNTATLSVPNNAIISNVHIGRSLASQGMAFQWNLGSYYGFNGQTVFTNGQGLGSGGWEWQNANSALGITGGCMGLSSSGDLSIAGNLNVSKDRNVFLNYDSYWGNASYATFGSVLSANVNLGYSFTARTGTSRVELNCMYQNISGSGTRDQDVMFFKPVLWANGNSGTPATATGNNLSGTRVNRDNPSVTECARNFNTTAGTSYLIICNLYFQDQNDQFNLHIHGGTLRML
jgi:hypothetical protein